MPRTVVGFCLCWVNCCFTLLFMGSEQRSPPTPPVAGRRNTMIDSAKQEYKRAYRIARLIERHPAPGTDPEDCMITHPVTGALVKLSITDPEPSSGAYSAARYAAYRVRDTLAMRCPGRIYAAQQSWRADPEWAAMMAELGMSIKSQL